MCRKFKTPSCRAESWFKSYRGLLHTRRLANSAIKRTLAVYYLSVSKTCLGYCITTLFHNEDNQRRHPSFSRLGTGTVRILSLHFPVSWAAFFVSIFISQLHSLSPFLFLSCILCLHFYFSAAFFVSIFISQLHSLSPFLFLSCILCLHFYFSAAFFVSIFIFQLHSLSPFLFLSCILCLHFYFSAAFFVSIFISQLHSLSPFFCSPVRSLYTAGLRPSLYFSIYYKYLSLSLYKSFSVFLFLFMSFSVIVYLSM